MQLTTTTMPRTALLCVCYCLTLALVASGARGERPAERIFDQEQLDFWAFQPIERRAPPAVMGEPGGEPVGEIDAFLLARLREKGLSFSAPATRRELIRRATLDLHGLPPTPEEVRRFLADDAPDAYERLIDRLLASPRYGEKWGRLWLDLVRYSETAGFNADPLRPLAYKYRDYVIRSFNDDTPYDRFVHEQLAGDELFPESEQALIATGYNLMWPDESNASDVLLARQDALNDLTANVGAVFLGLTMGCAQCHDHKFDPILQSDFYQLQAFFAGVTFEESAPLGTAEQLRAYREQLDAWMAETEAARVELHALERDARARAGHVKRLKFCDEVLAAIDTMPELRDAKQRMLAFWAERQIEVNEKQLTAALSEPQRQRRETLQAELAEANKRKPKPPRTVKVMAALEPPSGPTPTYLLAGGGYEEPIEETLPGYPTILADAFTATIESPREGVSGRRTTLARWITHPENPLASRVMINRVWQGHFGRGLVENGNDFGVRTAPPTHPELLDWLASDFVASGWSIKAIHRRIMTSRAYRQSSYRRSPEAPEPAALAADPDNGLYWSFPRRRLEAESIRDSLLLVAGDLNLSMYGPGVHPELPPNFSSRHGWKPEEDEASRNRRSVYIHAKRNLPYPLLQVFDLPDMHESCARRAETTVAPQALMLLNSELVLRFARRFAERILSNEALTDDASRVAAAYEAALAREPVIDELQLVEAFLDRQTELALAGAEQPEASEKPLATEDAAAAAVEQLTPEAARREAFVDFCHALLNANEFLYYE